VQVRAVIVDLGGVMIGSHKKGTRPDLVLSASTTPPVAP
jgi:hypothetical protein